MTRKALGRGLEALIPTRPLAPPAEPAAEEPPDTEAGAETSKTSTKAPVGAGSQPASDGAGAGSAAALAPGRGGGASSAPAGGSSLSGPPAATTAPPATSASAASTPTTAEPGPRPAGPDVREVPMAAIQPNPWQPRRQFAPERIRELAASIKANGILQPLLVRPATGASPGTFELVAGERRLRAARAAGLASVPVQVRDTGDDEMLRLALLENIQREDLNPIEEARAYRRLLEEFDMSQQQLADQLGRSRSAIANALRLLQLPPDIQHHLETGRLTAGHARAILAAGEPEAQRELAAEILAEGLSVREVERIAQKPTRKRTRSEARRPGHPVLAELQKRLEERVGTRARIRPRKADGSSGRIEIDYYSSDDLERIFEIVGVSYLT